MDTLARLRHGCVTASADETRRLGEALAGELPADCTLALSGPLGTGKTTVVQGLARGWNVSEPVTSPTFNLFHFYRGTRLLLHLDAYRLERPAEMDALMIDDFLASPYCLVVEWPEKTGDWLPAERFTLSLDIEDENRHRFLLVGWPAGFAI